MIERAFCVPSPPDRRPFRFGASVQKAASAREWADLARRTEASGYSTLQMPDHFGKQFAIGPALGAAAAATSTLRLGCAVYANDYRHPALLAKEVATLDVLTEGRVEFGLGAGWNRDEYDALGIPFESPAVRVARLAEAVEVLLRLFHGGPVSFEGRFYRLTNYTALPRPTQTPHPPLLIGGGGHRVLALAGQKADIAGIVQRARPEGGLDMEQDDEAVFAARVDWIRQSSTGRSTPPELHMLIWDVDITLVPQPRALSPHTLRGTPEQIVDTLQERRDRYGVSYISILGKDMERFAPIAARLAGQ